MSPEEKVLSQADIDALVAKVPPKPAAPKPAAVKPTPPPVAVLAAAPGPVVNTPPVAESAPPSSATTRQMNPPRDGTAKYEKYTSNEVAQLQNNVADLARQVAKMTNMMQRLESAESKVAQIYSLLKLDPEASESLGSRLDGIYARVEEIASHYSDYQAEFQCHHCKSKQMMALHVKCTSCGEETWMGWWPEGNLKK